uniref:Alpha-1,6-mannosyl-glycoprotein 6-beta-N-acetylglucosaminyltransferase n=1 Tax=Mycena chlorophos TaxID=658473 RepID=A0ABQ0L5N0_MYCCL|nr:predicted protein [Mycena chlorophos]
MSSAIVKRPAIWALSTLVFAALLLFSFHPNAPTVRFLPHATWQKEPQDDLQVGLSRLLQHLYPERVSNSTTPAPWNKWVTHNQRSLSGLFACLETGVCGENQTSVVLLGSAHFIGPLEGHVGGEDIWGLSTIEALDAMGYTYIFSPHWDGTEHPANVHVTMEFYHMFPDLVKVIIAEAEEIEQCWYDRRCILSPENPYGIPAWKMFSWGFWAGPANPLGAKWSLNPEDFHRDHSWIPPNTYLGYSVEHGCKSVPYIPHAERPNPSTIYIYAKWGSYFFNHPWGMDYYRSVAEELDGRAHLLMGTHGELPDDFPVDVVENMGQMKQQQFYEMLSGASLVIGVGAPTTSPSMYDALCLGVPVINPILQWDESRSLGDKEGFMRAVKDALAHPIESYILPHMTMGAVEGRLGKIIEGDWKAEAEKLLEERQKTGDGPLFTV